MLKDSVTLKKYKLKLSNDMKLENRNQNSDISWHSVKEIILRSELETLPKLKSRIRNDWFDDEYKEKIVTDTKFNEVINLNLTKKMISDFQDAFSILDCTGDGIIGDRDIKVTLRALGIEPTSRKIKKLIDKGTTKKSNEISRQDYEKMMLFIINDIDSDEQMEKSFEEFDIGKTGAISIEELKIIAHKLEFDIVDQELEEMMQVAGNNKDNNVSKKEFMEIARKIF
ncbi:uncharacterized protein TNCT_677201 [Trichonephila clavata]|uniref:EF-hand domain-containing protein n=1 Tax=Trichonephila clavata TaxID=2740835 RepID=A0A8X6FEU4_TRICU|nr:uncharacterized protein TNCT_677201 [Trichonephila clavata]